MFFKKSNKLPEVFRRDWGEDQREPLIKHTVALDAITPSSNDCSMRIIYREGGAFAVSITFYSDIYFSPPIRATRSVSLSKKVIDELLEKGHILPFSFFGIPSVDTTMWTVSDEGERVWTRMIGN